MCSYQTYDADFLVGGSILLLRGGSVIASGHRHDTPIRRTRTLNFTFFWTDHLNANGFSALDTLDPPHLCSVLYYLYLLFACVLFWMQGGQRSFCIFTGVVPCCIFRTFSFRTPLGRVACCLGLYLHHVTRCSINGCPVCGLETWEGWRGQRLLGWRLVNVQSLLHFLGCNGRPLSCR